MSAEAVVPESYYTPISYLSSSARSMRIVKNGADIVKELRPIIHMEPRHRERQRFFDVLGRL